MTTDSGAGLLATADHLISHAPAAVMGTWHRGACFALRRAVEECIVRFFHRTGHWPERCSMRAKLISLEGYTGEEAARRAKAVWNALSLACHYHHYELAPTGDQLKQWRAEVGVVLALLEPATHGWTDPVNTPLFQG